MAAATCLMGGSHVLTDPPHRPHSNKPMRPSLRLRRGQKSTTPSRWKSRLIDLAILTAAAVVCLFVFSFSTRLSYSRPEVREAPEIIRVQILNGSGKAGMARTAADHLTMLAVGRMRFDAIDVGNFDRADIKRTFVINRRLTPEQVSSITSAWGLGESELSDGSGRSNDLGVDLTIVLGANVLNPSASAQAEPQKP